MRLRMVAVSVVLLAAACGDDGESDDAAATTTAAVSAPTSTTVAPATTTVETTAAASSDEVLFPDVVDAELERRDDGTYRVSVTLSSPYDTPERYADAWRVLDVDGNVLGVRELLHDHQNEQPFTRSLDGVEIPEGTDAVVVEGRDQVSGWGGATLTVAVP